MVSDCILDNYGISGFQNIEQNPEFANRMSFYKSIIGEWKFDETQNAGSFEIYKLDGQKNWK